MAILVDSSTRLVVQGITGRDGSFHTRAMKAYGTNVVAGVTPGKGGQDFEGIPIFDRVSDAVKRAGANTSVVYVPPAFAADAILESMDKTIGQKTVTYDFARLMEGATKVKCSEFATAMIDNM